jgi:hypothetical protein
VADEHDRPLDWRGAGIHVEGGFSIRDLTVGIDATTGDAVLGPVTAEVRTDTWHHWLAVATDAAGAAATAHERAVAAGDDNDAFGEALEQEFRASMTAVAAAAFALDAFYGSTVAHVPDAKVRCTTRAATILETFKRAYEMKPPAGESARRLLWDLFRFRHQAVHPPAEFVEPVAHPEYGRGMEPRFVMFRAENAIRSRDGAHLIIWHCLHNPCKAHAALVEWCDAVKTLVDAPPRSAYEHGEWSGKERPPTS